VRKTTLDNTQGKLGIAAALQEIGILLELKGGRYFQARAYKAAARVVAELEPSLNSLIKENQLTAISGIGSAIAAQIKEIDRTGTSRMLEQLRSELPRGALELATVPGLSLQKIQQLQEALGISSIAELKSRYNFQPVDLRKRVDQSFREAIVQVRVGRVAG
jgi:DNA polymerase (family 10)